MQRDETTLPDEMVQDETTLTSEIIQEFYFCLLTPVKAQGLSSTITAVKVSFIKYLNLINAKQEEGLINALFKILSSQIKTLNKNNVFASLSAKSPQVINQYQILNREKLSIILEQDPGLIGRLEDKKLVELEKNGPAVNIFEQINLKSGHLGVSQWNALSRLRSSASPATESEIPSLPNRAQTALNLAIAHSKEGKFDESLSILEKLSTEMETSENEFRISHFSNQLRYVYAITLTQVGQNFFKTNCFDEALNFYNLGLEKLKGINYRIVRADKVNLIKLLEEKIHQAISNLNEAIFKNVNMLREMGKRFQDENDLVETCKYYKLAFEQLSKISITYLRKNQKATLNRKLNHLAGEFLNINSTRAMSLCQDQQFSAAIEVFKESFIFLNSVLLLKLNNFPIPDDLVKALREVIPNVNRNLASSTFKIPDELMETLNPIIQLVEANFVELHFQKIRIIVDKNLKKVKSESLALEFPGMEETGVAYKLDLDAENIEDNDIDGIFKYLAERRITRLTELDLSATSITGVGLNTIAAQHEKFVITSLTLCDAALDLDKCGSLRQLTSLRTLNISNNNNLTSGNFGSLVSMPLESITLDGFKCGGAIFENFSPSTMSPFLKILQLEYNEFKDDTVGVFVSMAHLEVLDLCGSNFSFLGAKILLSHPNLKLLDLRDHNLSVKHADKLQQFSAESPQTRANHARRAFNKLKGSGIATFPCEIPFFSLRTMSFFAAKEYSTKHPLQYAEHVEKKLSKLDDSKRSIFLGIAEDIKAAEAFKLILK